ncbi:hypothetical protein O3P69_007810 [Scylla paramamosain]|uniref:Uncharacterized protein n=1 Tax=Scylla paramamosain TaxID=85552 RepID=A0AAW0SKJ1_SCYPA
METRLISTHPYIARPLSSQLSSTFSTSSTCTCASTSTPPILHSGPLCRRQCGSNLTVGHTPRAAVGRPPRCSLLPCPISLLQASQPLSQSEPRDSPQGSCCSFKLSDLVSLHITTRAVDQLKKDETARISWTARPSSSESVRKVA